MDGYDTNRAQDISMTWFRPSQDDPTLSQQAEIKETESYWKSVIKTAYRRKSTIIFTIVLLFLSLFSLIQPFLPNQRDYSTVYNDPITGLQLMNQQPNAEFWLGTNKMGQDLWSRLWAATRFSLGLGVCVAVFRSLLGMTFGMVWGYVKQLDFLFTEIYNVVNHIPSTIILLVASYLLKPGVLTLILAMSATGWISHARLVRNQVIIIRNQEYNQASFCLGTPLFRILLQNILPHTLTIVIIHIAQAIPAAIGGEVFLAYLGLGLPVNVPSLGTLVDTGRMLIMTPSLRYQFYAPATVLSLITVSFYILGRRFSDAADPKTHHREAH